MYIDKINKEAKYCFCHEAIMENWIVVEFVILISSSELDFSTRSTWTKITVNAQNSITHWATHSPPARNLPRLKIVRTKNKNEHSIKIISIGIRAVFIHTIRFSDTKIKPKNVK